jgi:ferredoxin
MLHRVHFRKENITVHAAAGANLRQACLDHDVDPYPLLGGLLSCRGKGFCGTCAVIVDEPDALSAPSKREARYLRKQGDFPGLRLSCQATLAGDVTIDTDPDTRPNWRTHSFYSGQPTRSWEPAV